MSTLGGRRHHKTISIIIIIIIKNAKLACRKLVKKCKGTKTVNKKLKIR